MPKAKPTTTAPKAPGHLWIYCAFQGASLDLSINTHSGDLLIAAFRGKVLAIGTDLHSKKDSAAGLQASGLLRGVSLGMEIDFQFDVVRDGTMGCIHWFSGVGRDKPRIDATVNVSEEAQAKIIAYRRDWRTFVVKLSGEPHAPKPNEEFHDFMWDKAILDLDFSTDENMPKNCVLREGYSVISEIEAKVNA